MEVIVMKRNYEKPELKVSEGRRFEKVYAGGCNMNSGTDQTNIQAGEGTFCASAPNWEVGMPGVDSSYGYGDTGAAPSN